ncbi:dematin-like [Planococcus citri]|uniref:dematin-like n=1 Tax=Planococcus citri TaxID=170843 RepID=UPI0031F804F6
MMSSMDRNSNYRFRSSSPGLILREYNKPHYKHEHISRRQTYSYLKNEPSLGYLKRPIEPYDKPPTSPHFHHPSFSNQNSVLKSAGGRARSAMRVLVESIRNQTPRPKSLPRSINHKEPIELAHFPAAKPPGRNEKAKIERDDFPAPPYPFADPECRKRWSSCYENISVFDYDDQADGVEEKDDSRDKMKKEKEELIKISSCSGIGNILLQNLKHHEKLQKCKQFCIDPRNASRCPSASKEPAYKLRYHSVDRNSR